MTRQFVIRVAARTSDQPPSRVSAPAGGELWEAAARARAIAGPDQPVRIVPVPSEAERDRKTGEIEGIVVLIGLAAYASKPILQFTVDLIREIGVRRRCKLTIKTRGGEEITYEGENPAEDLELATVLHRTITEAEADTSSPAKKQLTSAQSADIIIEVHEPETEDAEP